MTKKSKGSGGSHQTVKLGRSAVTGKYVLKPATKGGGSVSSDRVREVTRSVLSQNVAQKKA